MNEEKNKLLEALEEEDNFTLTENLATTYKSTKSALVDLFAMGGALRNRNENEIKSLFSKALQEDPLLAMKCLFYLRDIRGGQGERDTFRKMLHFVGNVRPEYVLKNLENIAFYGRFDDYFTLKGLTIETDTTDFLWKQFSRDLEALQKGNNVSLLAKWLPSENTSSKNTIKLAQFIRHKWNLSSKQYRKALSALRERIRIVERDMCANQWDDIDYEKVPSRASMLYRKAFGRHDQERYAEYLNAVEKGEKEIKTSTLYPYDIVREIAMKRQYDKTLDLQWKNQIDWTEGRKENSLVVCDTSGSMGSFGGYDGRNPQPIYISLSLALYFAERNKGEFYNYFITFSQSPELQKIIGNNIYEKLLNLSRADWDGNTDLQAVFDLILRVAINKNVSNDEMIKKIYIITDMEFDQADGDYSYYRRGQTNFEVIKQKFTNAGYEMPLLVFWNVDSRQNNVPVSVDERNVLLVSGSSPSVFKTLMSGKSYTPYEVMLEVLNSERYDRITI